ncbi:ankyrin repeat domain-containing protein [Sphingomonas sp. BK580]|uniref:ankyrin repeat domain-containing protein n=1 Tax=Sphingomonas sp. BK580 TaxID=2586972 RepID=UPI0016107B38|nr:ankyrin repeat domain-containing protein [Sphingomonas sp. BK580]MBB3693585.1 ankyrin repeat protein [Sphingomonas sp. BK580]
MRQPSRHIRTFLVALALSGCNLSEQWRPGSTEVYRPVFEQASRGDVPAVVAALDREPRLVRAQEDDGLTLLHDAAAEGQLRMAEVLIDRGARLEAKTGGGLTPMHLAAQSGDLPMIEMLARRGARLNATDRRGRTPLDQSIQHGHPEIADWLRSHGGREGRRSRGAAAD